MEITYREMKDSDRSTIIDLFYDFCELYTDIDKQKISINSRKIAEWCLTDIEEKIKKSDGKVIVALFNKKIVGFIGFFLKNSKEDGLMYHRRHKYGMVDSLYIDSKYRNNNIGDHLLKLSESYFKEKQCEFVKLQVLGTNPKAYKFYMRNNYIPRNIELIKKI